MSDKSTFLLNRLDKPDFLLQNNYSDILSRIKSFLPQISAANRILEDNQKAGLSEESIATVEDLSTLDSDDDDDDSCSDTVADEEVDEQEKAVKAVQFNINLLADESDEDESMSEKKLIEEVKT